MARNNAITALVDDDTYKRFMAYRQRLEMRRGRKLSIALVGERAIVQFLDMFDSELKHPQCHLTHECAIYQKWKEQDVFKKHRQNL